MVRTHGRRGGPNEWGEIGAGTLYEEDDNSPLDNIGNGSDSITYTISGDYDQIIVVFAMRTRGYDRLRINGVTTSDYKSLTADGTENTGLSQIDIGAQIQNTGFQLVSEPSLNNVGVINHTVRKSNSRASSGELQDAPNGDINSFTLFDSGNNPREVRARVYGRDVQ